MDYLKYDWCSYRAGSDNVALPADLDPRVGQDAAPYAVMRAALDKADRDIVYSFCQYGMGDVWKWGAEIGGNLWRTTGDINDSWNSMHNNYESEALAWPYAGPGHWNDPDMLVVGMVGWGAPHPNNLTPNEQVVHMTMWCLLAAPLLIGCDMTNLDPLTLNLLTNDEAIDVDQDPLGVQARKVPGDYDGEIWWRPLADGGKAVGLINPTLSPLEMTVKWSWIGLSGRHRARDLWLHQNLGAFSDGYTVTVPAHGAVMLRVK
jgi:alpha-galactosidase